MATTSQNPSAPQPQRLGGFELLDKIGEGGMGAVYRAKQISLDRVVALKVLSSRLVSDPKYTDSFLREAKAAARLQHSNIVAVHDAGKADGHYYYAMEYVQGETLHKWVQREGALPEETVLGVGICIANALKHGWDREQLIHRDIKPENIIIDHAGNVKLLDLGLAKSFGENTLLSLSGQVFGTPQYMSPEQARAQKVDCRTDIYALGLTLYFAVTGEIPFHGGNATQVMARKLTEQLPDPREFAPETSAHFCRMLEKMTAQEVEHRYTSWDDVLRDLHLVRAGTAPQIPLAFAGTSAMKRLGGLKPVEGRAPSRPSPHDGGTGVPPVDSNFEQEGNEEHQDPLRPSRPSVKHSAPQVSGLSPQPSKKTRTTLIASAFLTLLVLVLAATDSKLCLPQK